MTQFFLRHNAPASIICFLLLVTTTIIGCGVLFNVDRVNKLDPVILTQADYPKMKITSRRGLHGFPKESSIVIGCQQRWNATQMIVRYYLFDSVDTAQKAWKNPWGYRVAAVTSDFYPEHNPENIIGDATWHYIAKRESDRVYDAEILFVKKNVAVLIFANEMQFVQVQDVARKIEAKIAAVLEKNKNTDNHRKGAADAD